MRFFITIVYRSGPPTSTPIFARKPLPHKDLGLNCRDLDICIFLDLFWEGVGKTRPTHRGIIIFEKSPNTTPYAWRGLTHSV